MKRAIPAILSALAAVGANAADHAPLATTGDVPVFVEEARAADVAHVYGGPFEFFVGGGVAVFDCDGDRREDMVVAGGKNETALYRNVSAAGGTLEFEHLSLGLEPRDAANALGAYPIDLDNDGRKDLVILRVGQNLLLRGLPECRFEKANKAFGASTKALGGIVVTVGHERDHHGRAEEHFLPAGPFAILPLKGKRSSLVWTETRKEAARLTALGEEEFHAELERRFGLHLGEIEALDKPRAFPLGYFVARSFIADRLALVGDAAHLIHPIAGQGLNMGLKDVAALAEVVVDAARLGMDPGQADVLERYQRWRRFDTMAMGVATNSLNFLFSNESKLLRTVRDIGLGLVDRAPPLKSLFIRQAAGLTGEVPRLLKGEAL